MKSGLLAILLTVTYAVFNSANASDAERPDPKPTAPDIVVTYPAAPDEATVTAWGTYFFANMPDIPMERKASSSHWQMTARAREEFIKSAFFASQLYYALKAKLPDAHITFEPSVYKLNSDGTLTHQASGLSQSVSALVVNFWVYSYPTSTETLLDDKYGKEALTAGDYVTPAFEIATNFPELTAGLQFPVLPMGSWRLNDPNFAKSPTYRVRRIELDSGDWDKYLEDTTDQTISPFMGAWADDAASKIVSVYRSIDKAQLAEEEREQYASLLLNGDFTYESGMQPAAWHKLIDRVMLSETQLRERAGEAVLDQFVKGEYGQSVRTMIQQECQAIRAYESEQRKQNLASVLNVVGVLAGAYAASQPSSYQSSSTISNSMIQLNEAYIAGNAESDSRERSLMKNLDRMTEKMAEPQAEQQEVIAFNDESVSVQSITDFRTKMAERIRARFGNTNTDQTEVQR